MGRLLNLYIFTEMMAPFFLCLAVLTSTALLTKTIKLIGLIVSQGLGAYFAFWFLVSVLPSFLIYTIPISFLVAVLITFTRLSSDSEFIAMKALGLNLFTITRPVLIFAFFTFSMTLACTLFLYPWGNHNLKRILIEGATKNIAASIQEKTFYDRLSDLVIYVDHVSQKSGELEGVFIARKTPSGKSDIFVAEKAVIGGGGEGSSSYIKLVQGTSQREDRDRNSYHVVNFSSYILELTSPGEEFGGAAAKSNRELYPGEMVARIKEIKARGGFTPPYVMDLHKRFALPVSIFIFGLIGATLGILEVRSTRLTGFSISLGVVLLYYVLSTALEGLGENGIIGPLAAVWGSNIITGLIAFYAFYMKSKDKEVGLTRLLSLKRSH
ncbi:MAG: LPS export ABC transporter permease LptF [Thermodesulfobacteriota bacterium]